MNRRKKRWSKKLGRAGQDVCSGSWARQPSFTNLTVLPSPLCGCSSLGLEVFPESYSWSLFNAPSTVSSSFVFLAEIASCRGFQGSGGRSVKKMWLRGACNTHELSRRCFDEFAHQQVPHKPQAVQLLQCRAHCSEKKEGKARVGSERGLCV